MKATVVIPVYNHGRAVSGVVARVLAANVPCILVDDGSEADTAAELRRLADDHAERVALIVQPVNGGKGSAVLAGIEQAHALGYTHAVQIDADGQHDASCIPEFLDAARAHPQAVIVGQPVFDASIPKVRLVSRYLTHVWVWIETLSFEIRDSMCGFRVYPVAAVRAIAGRVRVGRRMDFDTEILVRLYWDGAEIINVPTPVRYPEDGLSHFRMWRDNVLITRMHTMLFFGMLARLPRLLVRRRRGV